MNSLQLQRSAYVWLAAGIGLTIYASLGMMLEDIPGLQQLVAFLESLTGPWVLLAVFVAIVLEGLYFFGSFFPGSSIVVLLAVLATFGNVAFFLLTISTIFAGWVLAGAINIYFAKRYRAASNADYMVKDRTLATWFPAFRANYEVAQIVSGGDPQAVFWSSVRVKAWASLFMAGIVYILSLTVDVAELSNDEGFATLYISAAIMLIVGIVQWRKSRAVSPEARPRD